MTKGVPIVLIHETLSKAQIYIRMTKYLFVINQNITTFNIFYAVSITSIPKKDEDTT